MACTSNGLLPLRQLFCVECRPVLHCMVLPRLEVALCIMYNCLCTPQEAERLKKENEELRKLGEDAVLDQQLSKALQETDKLKLAADAYKKELLQQKVTELQSELAQTSKRLKVAEEENLGEVTSCLCCTYGYQAFILPTSGKVLCICHKNDGISLHLPHRKHTREQRALFAFRQRRQSDPHVSLMLCSILINTALQSRPLHSVPHAGHLAQPGISALCCSAVFEPPCDAIQV